MEYDPKFLIDICDEDFLFYKSKSGNKSTIERWEASSHKWTRDKKRFIGDQWRPRYKCECGSQMNVYMGRVESDEDDMLIIIKKKRECLSREEWAVKDIVE